MGNVRSNVERDDNITFDWLEQEVQSHKERYLVIRGWIDIYDEALGGKTPNLEELLNFMDERGYEFVNIYPMHNPAYKEIVWKRK